MIGKSSITPLPTTLFLLPVTAILLHTTTYLLLCFSFSSFIRGFVTENGEKVKEIRKSEEEEKDGEEEKNGAQEKRRKRKKSVTISSVFS